MIAIVFSCLQRAQDFVVDGKAVESHTVVKKVIDELLAARRGDRAGIIVLGDDAITLSPVSHDLTLVRELLRDIRPGIAGEKPALGDALALAVKRLRERPPAARILLLFTDSTFTAGGIEPVRAGARARRGGGRGY